MSSATRPPSLREIKEEWDQLRLDSSFEQSFVDYRQQRLKGFKNSVKATHEDPNLISSDVSSQQMDSEPWKKIKEWRSNKIQSNAKRNILWLLAGSVACFIAPLPYLSQVTAELASGNNYSLLIFLFPLIGLVVAWSAIVKIHDYLKYGVVYLNMEPYPGRIGGQVGGIVDLKGKTNVPDSFSIALECVLCDRREGGVDRTIWQSSQITQLVNEYQEVHFAINIPSNLPAADIVRLGRYHAWVLSLKASDSSINFAREFNIPVFKF